MGPCRGAVYKPVIYKPVIYKPVVYKLVIVTKTKKLSNAYGVDIA
jgi:hypothetical protein